ncbi:MAG: TRAP transporter TatT component family protein [Spirochaetia bacterium]|nr:TRAP transporter TatT component family protein [Spirochaetia bacterium]
MRRDSGCADAVWNFRNWHICKGQFRQVLFQARFRRRRATATTTLEQKARFHFNQAVELSDGHALGPYVALAGSIAVKNQDAQEYRRLLEKALSIEVDKYPEMRLENTILQEKARWMLEHIEDKFLVLD